MAKGHRHLKRLKSEKAKVKLKKSKNQLPKGLNVTDTSFKVKKILIREQLKHQDETEVLSTRKLNIKDLLMRLRHHNSTMRDDALKQLKEILLRYPPEVLHSQLNSLLCGIAALSLDKEKNIRRDSLNALNLILGPISNEQLMPFRGILTSYLLCAMTHIDPNIKEDSLRFLDILVQNCKSIIMKESHKILPKFLVMISRLHHEIGSDRQLTTIVNAKNTSIKWRIKVLERLANIFTVVTRSYKESETSLHSHSNLFSMTAVNMKKCSKNVPVYTSTRVCDIDFDKDPSSVTNCVEGTLSMEEFVKYVGMLMPLIFHIWIEVCPDEKCIMETTISSEAFALLKSMVEIIQSIIEYIDILNCDEYDAKHIKHWFKKEFHAPYMKTFLSRFPYKKVKQHVKESRKHQEDLSQTRFTEREDCLEQNLGLCQIHIWITSVISNRRDKHLLIPNKNCCISVVRYLNGTMRNWSINNSSALPQLTKLLRNLFLEANPILHANDIYISHTLELIVDAFSRLSQEEPQPHLSLIIGEIMLEYSSAELYGEKAFQNFVTTLPSLLLRPSIDDITIRMISRIVLCFKNWIGKELATKSEAIIENAKKIEIIGSCDIKHSRLMICNLFYFMDTQVYY